jgi:hypothetical protein
LRLWLSSAWLSHSAYDARMVNMAEGIYNHDMPDTSVMLLSQSAL